MYPFEVYHATITKTKIGTKTFKEHPERAILETCDPCNVWLVVKNYDISDNGEHESQHSLHSDSLIKSDRGQHLQFLQCLENKQSLILQLWWVFRGMWRLACRICHASHAAQGREHI